MMPVRRPRGRPPLEPDARAVVDLRLKLAPELYERICRIALRVNQPVWVVARKMLERDAQRADTLSI